MPSPSAMNWERHQTGAGSYCQWPNETMVKVLFGSYLASTRKPVAGDRVLDIGCGAGQNLLPFAACGCEVFGVELTQGMIEHTRSALAERGISATLAVGTNRAIPFPDESFEFLLSVNSIHYENNLAHYRAALKEYARVLRQGGKLFICTTGPNHEIRAKATRLDEFSHRIADYDFRNGEVMTYMPDETRFRDFLGETFSDVEIGRTTEKLMTRTLDYLVAVATK